MEPIQKPFCCSLANSISRNSNMVLDGVAMWLPPILMHSSPTALLTAWMILRESKYLSVIVCKGNEGQERICTKVKAKHGQLKYHLTVENTAKSALTIKMCTNYTRCTKIKFAVDLKIKSSRG